MFVLEFELGCTSGFGVTVKVPYFGVAGSGFDVILAKLVVLALCPDDTFCEVCDDKAKLSTVELLNIVAVECLLPRLDKLAKLDDDCVPWLVEERTWVVCVVLVDAKERVELDAACAL